MKLYYSNYSVFSRKVRMVIDLLVLTDQVEFISVHAENNLFIDKINPLRQAPVLVSNDGDNLFGSTLICQYFVSLKAQQNIYPQNKNEYFRSLSLEALSDGAVALIDQIVEERFRPKEQQSKDLETRNWKILYESLSWLEQRVSDFDPNISIGEISVACFVDYLGFHFRKEVADWTKQYPKLGQWFSDFKNKELMQTTKYHSI